MRKGEKKSEFEAKAWGKIVLKFLGLKKNKRALLLSVVQWVKMITLIINNLAPLIHFFIL